MVEPFFLRGADELRPPPPPELASQAWARDYEEIRQVGARASDARTAEQTEAARFWTITGPAGWNPVVRALAATRPSRPVETARLFALASLAAADAFLAVFDAKYDYGLWRPITAIRNGDLDGKRRPAGYLSWVPLVDTPMHPEYPCAHCITAAAVGAVLEAEFGRGEPGHRDDVPDRDRRDPPLAPHRRLRRRGEPGAHLGGVHYRFSTEVGQAMGREIGARATARLLAPVRSIAH